MNPRCHRSQLSFCSWILVVTAGQILAAQPTEPQKHPFEDKLLPALFNQEIRLELELVDDQKQELDSLLETLKKQKESLGLELRDFSQTASAEQIKAKREELVRKFELQKNETQSTIMNVLLPHQKTRLRQATSRLMLRELAKQKKVPTGILSSEIMGFLDIGDEQARRIEKKATEIQKRLAEQIQKLTEQAQADLMQELTPEQRSKYEKLIGDPIRPTR